MRSYSACLSLALALAGPGCGAADEEPVETVLGGLTVRIESNPAKLTISDADGNVLIDGFEGGPAGDTFPPPMIAGATRSAVVDWQFQSGSFLIEETLTDPWIGVTKFRNLRTESGAVRFDLRGSDGALGTASVEEAGDGELTITYTFPEDQNRASIAFNCASDEHFLGMGGQTASVDHRGFTVPLWVAEDGLTKAPVDTYDWGVWFLQGRLHSTHTPMPMFVSSRGYAMILETSHRSIFSFCDEADDAVRIEAWEPELRLRLFYGPSPLESIKKMTAYVGRPDLPPKFTFAPWLDAIYGSANVRRVAADLRAADVPTSVIWSEDWRGGNQEGLGYVLEEDWEVDRDLYPDFEDVASELHDLGYKFLIYHNTFLDSRVPAHAEAVAGDYTIKDANGDVYLFSGVKFEPTTLLDLSNPDAIAWGKQKYRDSLELGADGYMADFAEWLPHDAVLASGEDPKAAHNLYPVEWAKLNKELFDEIDAEDGIDRLFFVRAAYMGSQPHVSVVWAGDQQTDFSEDDGIASVIPMGIGLGVTGFPYFGHDIAGYMSQLTEAVTKELWFRWVTFGALSPVMRTHHGRDAMLNWNWESDAESTAHMARWARLHIQLFPYLYAMAKLAADEGTPMFRAVALSYPSFEPGWSLRDEFMLGDRIIVAPVLTQGATSRTVHLPPGVFYPLFGGGAINAGASGTEMNVDVALDEIAAYVPAGTVLVLLPRDVDTLVDASPTSGVVTLADKGDDREVWIWPGGASQMDEVSGLHYGWEGTGLSGAVTTATFDGATISPQTDTQGDYYELTGPGTLVLNGTATLTVTGGATDRSVIVRVRGTP